MNVHAPQIDVQVCASGGSEPAHEAGIITAVIAFVPEDKLISLFFGQSAHGRCRVKEVDQVAQVAIVGQRKVEVALQVGQFACPGRIRPFLIRYDSQRS